MLAQIVSTSSSMVRKIAVSNSKVKVHVGLGMRLLFYAHPSSVTSMFARTHFRYKWHTK